MAFVMLLNLIILVHDILNKIIILERNLSQTLEIIVTGRFYDRSILK